MNRVVNNVKKKYDKLSINAKATIWYTFSNVIQKAINVLVIPIYTRLLSTADYGTYSVFISWAEIFEIIVTFRLFYGAYVVGLVKFEDDRRTYTSSLEKLTLVITTAFLIIYLMFQDRVNNITQLSTSLTLIMFIMLYAIPIVGFWKAWQRVRNNYIEMVIVSLILALLTPFIGVILLLFLKSNAMAVIASKVGIEAGIGIILLIFFRKDFTAKVDFKYWKYALCMNIPLIPYYLSLVILNHSDRIIIQHLVGYSEAGIYSVAYSAAMVMNLFSQSFNLSLQPWLYKKLKEKEYNSISKTITSTVLLVAIVNVLLIIIAPEAIAVLAPKPYHEAIWIVPPLAASVFVMFCYQNFINVEFFFNESKITAVASISAALLNVVLNFALIPRFGYLAAGYTTLVSYILFFACHYFFVKYVCKKNNCPFDIFNIRKMMMIFVGVIVVSIVLLVTYKSMLLRYGLLVIGIVICIKNKQYLNIIVKK